MRICLIGSSGFLANAIGKHCNNKNWFVTAMGKNLSSSYTTDKFIYSELFYTDFPFEACLDNELIIYTAAKGGQSGASVLTSDIFYVNTHFPILLLEKLKEMKFKGRFVSFGSYFEIGNNNKNHFFNEGEIVYSHLPVPNSYCVSKRLLTRYFSSSSLPFLFFHFILPTIYGENEQPNRLIPYLIRSLRNDTKVQLTSGEQVRQYIYVQDLVKILFEILNRTEVCGIYNFISSETLTVREVAKKIFDYFAIDLKNEIFGSVTRTDVSMQFLQLDTKIFATAYECGPLHKVEQIISRYIDNELN